MESYIAAASMQSVDLLIPVANKQFVFLLIHGDHLNFKQMTMLVLNYLLMVHGPPTV